MVYRDLYIGPLFPARRYFVTVAVAIFPEYSYFQSGRGMWKRMMIMIHITVVYLRRWNDSYP